ncbi:hypothetical protein Zmor_019610 [Zophobas morio]|uniref:Histone H2A/H2B/H3 domain-containing protein n=1 Tax=Zophobas morio TaxID=2755281 RepID=A0AA38I2A0_9CUCU|nr:hypothetical protein Zmor_019610 [Zophobas morio]
MIFHETRRGNCECNTCVRAAFRRAQQVGGGLLHELGSYVLDVLAEISEKFITELLLTMPRIASRRSKIIFSKEEIARKSEIRGISRWPQKFALFFCDAVEGIQFFGLVRIWVRQ